MKFEISNSENIKIMVCYIVTYFSVKTVAIESSDILVRIYQNCMT
jgi:hypothetical protein